LAVSFPLLGRIRNFHPLATCAARRTIKKGCIADAIEPFFARKVLKLMRIGGLTDM